MKRYAILFEVESDRPGGEVASNIRQALERAGIYPSGIDALDPDSISIRREELVKAQKPIKPSK